MPSTDAPVAGGRRPAPAGEPVPPPRRPLDETRAITAPAPMLPLTASAFSTVATTTPDRTESARIALARARLRGAPVPDAVVFVATCPGCGRDAQWHEEREDTRLRVTISCDC